MSLVIKCLFSYKKKTFNPDVMASDIVIVNEYIRHNIIVK